MPAKWKILLVIAALQLVFAVYLLGQLIYIDLDTGFSRESTAGLVGIFLIHFCFLPVICVDVLIIRFLQKKYPDAEIAKRTESFFMLSCFFYIFITAISCIGLLTLLYEITNNNQWSNNFFMYRFCISTMFVFSMIYVSFTAINLKNLIKRNALMRQNEELQKLGTINPDKS